MDDTNSWGGGTSIQKRVQEIGLYGIEWGGWGGFSLVRYIFSLHMVLQKACLFKNGSVQDMNISIWFYR